MKKIALFISLFACIFLVTSCGLENETDNKQSNSDSPITTENNDQNTVLETEGVADGTIEKNNEFDLSADYDEDSWEYILKKYFVISNELQLSNDEEKVLIEYLSMTYPCDSIEWMCNSGLINFDVDTIMNYIRNHPVYDDITYTVISEDPQEDRNMVLTEFDKIKLTKDFYEPYNNDLLAIPQDEVDEFSKVYEEVSGNPDFVHFYNITDSIELKTKYLINGVKESVYFYLYKLEGDGWKIRHSIHDSISDAK